MIGLDPAPTGRGFACARGIFPNNPCLAPRTHSFRCMPLQTLRVARVHASLGGRGFTDEITRDALHQPRFFSAETYMTAKE